MAEISINIEGSDYVLSDGIHVIGRGEDADIQVDVGSLSRMHTRFTVEGDKLFVEDLGSKNGTFVNGSRIDARHTYTKGDKLRLGKSDCRVKLPAGAAPALQPAAPAAAAAAAAPVKRAAKKSGGEMAMIKKAIGIAVLVVFALIVYRIWPEAEGLVRAREIVDAVDTFLEVEAPTDGREELFEYQDQLREHLGLLKEVSPRYPEFRSKADDMEQKLEDLLGDLEKRIAGIDRIKQAQAAHDEIMGRIREGTIAPEQGIRELLTLQSQYQDTDVFANAVQTVRELEAKIDARYREQIAAAIKRAESVAGQDRYGEALEILGAALQKDYPERLKADLDGLGERSDRIRKQGIKAFNAKADEAIGKAENGDCAALKKEVEDRFRTYGLIDNQAKRNEAVAAIDRALALRLARAREAIKRELAEAEALFAVRHYREAHGLFRRLVDKTAEKELKKELEVRVLTSRLLADGLDKTVAYVNKKDGVKVPGVGLIRNATLKGYDVVEEENAISLEWKNMAAAELAGLFAAASAESADADLAAACGLLMTGAGREESAERYFEQALQRDADIKNRYQPIFAAFLVKAAARRAQREKEAALAAKKKAESRIKKFAAVSARPSAWANVGYGGGGAMYRPTFSPVNPNLMFVTSDMSGVFLSKDAGKSFRMINGLRYGYGMAFHPKNEKIMFAGTSSGLFRSEDGGDTWKRVTTDYQYPMNTVWHTLTDPEAPDNVWVSFGNGGFEPHMGPLPGTKCEVGKSTNGGVSFSNSTNGLPSSGTVQRLALDRLSPPAKRRLYAATSNGFFISNDHGVKWEEAGKGLPNKRLFALATLTDMKNRKIVILAGIVNGGIYRSEDRGKTFTASYEGLPDGGRCSPVAIGTAWNNPLIAYAGAGRDVYKSVDGGRTWKATGCGSPVSKCWYHVVYSWGSSTRGMGVCQSNAKIVGVTSDMYATRSDDGAQTWHDFPYHPKGKDAWHGGGLEVTYCYRVIVNPYVKNTYYGLYADIGSNRTEDNGASFKYNLGKWNTGIRSEWRNSTYGIAIDPTNPKKIWAAVSGFHNLPYCAINRTQYYIGGIAKSNTGGASWTECATGLPHVPATDVIVDRRFRAGTRKLVCTMIGEGVYYSESEGNKWEKMSDGLPSNPLVWRLAQSPKGDLYLACVQNRPGGVWKFDWKTKKWSRLPAVGNLEHAHTLYVGGDKEPDLVFVAGWGANGGLYRSADAGKTWKKVYSEQVKAFDRAPGGSHMYIGGKGIFRSIDRGAKWEPVYGMPFPNGVTGITIDPADPETIWVATPGGGIWRGPGKGVPSEKTDIR